MMLLRKDIEKLLQNATVLGTGGGGRLENAQKLLGKIDLRPVELVGIEALPKDGYVVTAYGVGGLTKAAVDDPAIRRRCQELLAERLGKPIVGVIPVEMGPGSVAQALALALALDVPLVDGDLAGMRAVPEIFIELVTLAKQERCPMILANSEGDFVILDALSSPEKIEAVARAFSSASASNVLAVGYPIRTSRLARSAALGSVNYCLTLGENLERDFTRLAAGTVTDDSKQDRAGFTVGQLQIATAKDVYTVVFKNENMVLLRNDQLVVTCPDFICIVDQKTGLGLNNGQDNLGKEVVLYVRPGVEQWRTSAGRRLFSPKALGLPYAQKLLKGNYEQA